MEKVPANINASHHIQRDLLVQWKSNMTEIQTHVLMVAPYQNERSRYPLFSFHLAVISSIKS